jgi:thiamine-phosphate pyrophosphorylase
VACLRIALATRDEGRISGAADALREVCHARDVAVVIDSHVKLSARLGLDGVHLPDARLSVRDARKELGADAIVGAFCGQSRHDGMSAGEAGADYISFGPVSETPLHDGRMADAELFTWWSEMIEVPVVAEGGVTPEKLVELAPCTDFFAIGDEIWKTEDPAASLTALMDRIR